MKKYWFIVLSLFTFAGCIKDAPLNPEADIERFVVDKDLLTADVIIDQANRKIQLHLKPDAFQNGFAPVLSLSTGAKVSPASGDSIRFDQPVYYTVTSQSGVNKKTYLVEIATVGFWTFNFENWGLQETSNYEFPLEDNGIQLWSSGNPGIALTGVDKRPDAYPMRSTTDGYNGTHAAEIITLKGNAVSELIGIKLFPGSLFLGTFNSSMALSNPPAATEFGQPYSGKPARFTGYYKYTPGAVFQDKDGNVINTETDKCALYAILYNGPARLNGTNIQTSEKIVAKAILADGSAQPDFTRFDIPFTYIPGAVAGNNLMVAIVASSSARGDLYRGAVGSRLVVDSLRIIPE
ncbi:MAG TPA: PCMD domain-containing protein [Flavipsychrobacter sp.]|nr:PCMD domain-containing protein [Flavipsychrobacter sp.]